MTSSNCLSWKTNKQNQQQNKQKIIFQKEKRRYFEREFGALRFASWILQALDNFTWLNIWGAGRDGLGLWKALFLGGGARSKGELQLYDDQMRTE